MNHRRINDLTIMRAKLRVAKAEDELMFAKKALSELQGPQWPLDAPMEPFNPEKPEEYRGELVWSNPYRETDFIGKIKWVNKQV